MSFMVLEKKFHDNLQLIAQYLGVTAGSLQDAINIANKANQDAEDMISDLEDRWIALTTEQQQSSEVIDARKGEESLRNKIDLMDGRTDGILSIFNDNAGFHNSIYRGKDLGTAVTSEQWTNIGNGTFKDMFIGDFWTINSTKYLIAAFNYFYNAGDTALTKNHITLIPAANMYSHAMNETHITTGGYMGSLMYTEGLDQAKTKINADFGEHLVKHRKMLSNATEDGVASAWAWVDSEVELMNEMMVFGSVVSGRFTPGVSNRNVGVEKAQLPLFALRPDIANIRATYWLQDVVSASGFAFVGNYGNATSVNAGYSFGVRPDFSISS